MQRKSLTGGEPQRLWHEATIHKGKRTRKLERGKKKRRERRREKPERGVICLGNVAELHRGKCLGQRAPKGTCIFLVCWLDWLVWFGVFFV